MSAARAGFWIRWAATVIDAAVVGLGAAGMVAVGARAGAYVPFELTALVAWVVGAVVLIAWKGRTPGKAWCGLRVVKAGGGHAGLGRTLLRETVGKATSAVVLFAGFWWIAISGRKRGWHDFIAGTEVWRDSAARGRGRVATMVACALSLAAVGPFASDVVGAYLLINRMSPVKTAGADYATRDPRRGVEVGALGDADRARCAEWLDQHGTDPVEYTVAAAREHQIVLVGEYHGVEQALDFLNALIPEARRGAGVTCVAMEACLAQDNEAMRRLVMAPTFDRELALELARHQPWGTWGWKGYWDVFETVWRLNAGLPEGEQRVRVVGLDRPMDLPSFAMLGMGDNPAVECAVWEKLRVFRVIGSLPDGVSRDAFMAQQVEVQILGRGERGIVWVGRNHSPVHAPQIGPGGSVTNRMGYLLGQRHGDAVFQVRLHGPDLPARSAARGEAGGRMSAFIESVMRLRNDKPVAFSVQDSPFAMLRDAGSFEYEFEPRLVMADVAGGYLFLRPQRGLTPCGWLDGYVSERMFVANRPYYEAIGRGAGRRVRSAADANAVLGGLPAPGAVR